MLSSLLISGVIGPLTNLWGSGSLLLSLNPEFSRAQKLDTFYPVGDAGFPYSQGYLDYAPGFKRYVDDAKRFEFRQQERPGGIGRVQSRGLPEQAPGLGLFPGIPEAPGFGDEKCGLPVGVGLAPEFFEASVERTRLVGFARSGEQIHQRVEGFGPARLKGEEFAVGRDGPAFKAPYREIFGEARKRLGA